MACTDNGDGAGPAASSPLTVVVATVRTSAAPATGAADGVISCVDAITATLRPDANARVVLGQVIVAGGTGDRALQTVRSGEVEPSQRLWSKTGLLTYDDREVVLEVPQGQSYWIGWGNPSVPSKRLIIQGCSGAAWTVFVGGFWTDAPKCVDLLVRTGGQQATVAVGLGDPCPGQSPPGAYTER